MRILVAGPAKDGETKEIEIEAPEGTALEEAVRIASEAFPFDVPDDAVYALWGREADPAQKLRDGDRAEITRPLLIDPNEARRLRAERAAAGRPEFSRGRHGGRHRLF